MIPAQACATWCKVGLVLLTESWSLTRLLNALLKHQRADVVGLRCLLLSWSSGRSALNNLGGDEKVSSSPSWAPFVCVSCAVAVGLVGVVVATVMVFFFAV